jgi:hypothetical protein
MFTFVVETAIGAENWDLLRFYADIVIGDPEQTIEDAALSG